MLDIKFIRNNPEIVKAACQNRQIKIDIDKLLRIDKEKREKQTALEEILAEKNKANKIISQTKNEKEKKKLILEMRELDKSSDRLSDNLKKLDNEIDKLMALIPNIPLDIVPIGKNDCDNIVIKEEGKKRKFDFQLKDHLELGEKLDLIDMKRAGKISGSRFSYLKNETVLLEFALINFTFDNLVKENFIPIVPPVMVKEEIMKAMGYLEQIDKDESYILEKDNIVLTGTAEHSIGPYFKDEILEEKDLPKRFAGFSTSFRREAGSYGKDTKGIFRSHQFDKIEMFSFAHPDKSKEEYEFLISMSEKLMKSLKIPYRIVKSCTGDLCRPSACTYDIESWFPAQNKYRETHSLSNCTDFQSRRLNIRYRDRKKGLRFIHTLNGTAFAIGRILIAIMENCQERDGSITIPEVLTKYIIGGIKEIKLK